MKILIMYMNIPESHDLWVVDVTPQEWKWMQLTHNHFINYKMTKKEQKACDKLYEWLKDKIKWSNEDIINVKTLGVDEVLVTGFGM